MKKMKKAIAALMTAVVAAACVPGFTPSAADGIVTAEAAAVKTAFTLSKKAGTYSKTIKVKLTAKSGWQIYYTKNGAFTKKNVLKNGQSRTFTVSKTATLTLYQSKTSLTAKQLRSDAVKKASSSYTYKIEKSTAVPTNPQQPDTGTVPVDVQQPDTGTVPANPQQPGSNNGNPDEVRSMASSMLAAARADEAAVVDAKPAEKKAAEAAADTPVITCLSENAEVSASAGSGAVGISTADGMCTVTIKEAGTYVLTGGIKNAPAKNVAISINADTTETVRLILDNLTLNNSGLGTKDGQDVPAILMEKGTKNVELTLKGASSLTGNGTYAKEPASGIIYMKDTAGTLTLLAADAAASLSVRDGMDAAADYGSFDPTDGISSKGMLVVQSGTYDISVNGDCLKGTGNSGSGGITGTGGKLTLQSMLGNGMKSKNGTISIYGSTIDMAYTAEDGINAKSYGVNIIGGEITIGQCHGDGIQGENVLISGTDTKLDITTVFADAGKNYYNQELSSYNTLVKTNTTKTETVNVDTGSHKGIKAGTKACTYTYRQTDAQSGLEAGKMYTQQASGGLVIAGGQIKVDTTQTGIKYNGSMSASHTGNLAPADNEGQYSIGAAEDAVHSNHTFFMSAGTLEIASADDGISAESSLAVVNESVVDITSCYEGMESGKIIIAAIGDASGHAAPQITIYSNDDGINAASSSKTHYDYMDESEAVYTKTQETAGDNTFYMLDGYVNVMIADDTEHSFSLPAADGNTTEGTFRADGDGIDCNGSFYAYGGTVIVYGSASGGNSPVDTDGAYYIGSGVTILAAGSGGMAENPTGTAQAVVSYGGTGRGMGRPDGANGNKFIVPGGAPESAPPDGMKRPTMPDGANGNGGMKDPQGQTAEAIAVSAGTAAAILDNSGNSVVAFKAPKAVSYLLYSSPALTAGAAYTISGGGTAGGAPVVENGRYDYRYTAYQTENAVKLAEVTAQVQTAVNE